MSIVKSIELNLFSALSYIVPKDKNLYCFFPLHNRGSFSGNLKALYLHANESASNSEKLVWITTTDVIKNQLCEKGFSVVKKRFPFWILLRAGTVLVDTSGGRFYGKFNIVQVWHGTGFKNIGVLDKKRRRSVWKSEHTNYNLFVANSQDDRERKEKSYPGATIVVTGSPRNDLFFQSESEPGCMKEKYNLHHYSKIYSYTPTFRETSSKKPFTDRFWENVNKRLAESNSLFVVKKHPYEKILQIPGNLSNVKDLSGKVADVQELLVFTDVLISDYSGIVTDFALLKKPLIFYMYDYSEFLENCRNFYYDIKDVLPGPFPEKEEQLLEYMFNLDWFQGSGYQNNYNAFLSKFHSFADGKSSKRVWDKIQRRKT